MNNVFGLGDASKTIKFNQLQTCTAGIAKPVLGAVKIIMALATIKVEFLAGDSIDGAFSEAIRLAKRLGVGVEFKFNDVTCWANAKSTVDNGVEAYHREIKKKDVYKYVVA